MAKHQWDIEAREVDRILASGFTDFSYQIAFGPNDNLAVPSQTSVGFAVQFWNLAGDGIFGRISLDERPTGVNFSTRNDVVAIVLGGNESVVPHVQVWSVSGESLLLDQPLDFDDRLGAPVLFSPQGDYMIVGGVGSAPQIALYRVVEVGE